MEALWASQTGTAREVQDRMGAGRAYTTIMTTVDRLHRKGLLSREKVGLAFRYRPALARDAYERAQAEYHIERLLDAHGEVALLAFVDAAERATSLDQLAALIAARRNGRS